MLFRRNPLSPVLGFFKHLIVFVLVNLFLFGLNVVTGGPWWFQNVLFGWGIGLFFHGLGATLGFVGRLAKLGR